MISAEYGWPDEYIMDLPLRRVRQIVAAIGERIRQKVEYSALVVEWQTKTLAAFIAGTIEVPKGKINPLLAAVESISLVQKKPEGMSRKPVEELTEAEIEAIVEGGAHVDAQPGTFERFAGRFRSGGGE